MIKLDKRAQIGIRTRTSPQRASCVLDYLSGRGGSSRSVKRVSEINLLISKSVVLFFFYKFIQRDFIVFFFEEIKHFLLHEEIGWEDLGHPMILNRKSLDCGVFKKIKMKRLAVTLWCAWQWFVTEYFLLLTMIVLAPLPVFSGISNFPSFQFSKFCNLPLGCQRFVILQKSHFSGQIHRSHLYFYLYDISKRPKVEK